MKILVTVAALATLLLPVMRCAGIGPDGKYEGSGLLTSDLTQHTCNLVSGFILEGTFGNQQCCFLSDIRKGDFNRICNQQKPGSEFPNFKGNVETC
ncbi:hypothetical protein PHMEG_0008639 [Phytophthora megakarya]|uniref:Elicitin n=1 Tax=Phytophthora megakarya TaxID=4795 RepID=A0A225WIG8_9STRA|nr:hypothetical protein PHMEG_0008639 [Phytophthora megakarya]